MLEYEYAYIIEWRVNLYRLYYFLLTAFMVMITTGCSRSPSDVQEISPSPSPLQSQILADPSIHPGSAKADTHDAELLLQAYESAIVEAVNRNDYSLVGRYIASNSQLSNLLKEFIEEQANEGVEQEILGYDLEQIEETDSAIQLYVRETISSKRPNQKVQSNESYWIYTVIVQDGQEK